jgi:hypothetical protein
MKRAVVAVAVAAIAVVPAAGHAAPKPPKKTVRTVTLEYQGFCTAQVSGAVYWGPNACPQEAFITVVLTKAEKYVTYKAEDASGTPTPMQVWTNGDYNSVGTVCSDGKFTSKKGGGSLDIATALEAPDCGGIPTQGTITITISNLP